MRAILTYHSIDESNSPISVGTREFDAHVRFLDSGRVRVVPLARILDDAGEGDAVALTFDDGFQNFAEYAMPRLSEHGLPATVFVVSDRVGTNNDWTDRGTPGVPSLPLMSWESLQSARDRGFEIGAHTRRHPNLSTLSGDALSDEVEECASRISSELGARPASFAYPYGAWSELAVSVVRRVYRRAVTTELRAISPEADPVLLPRLDMWYFRRPGALEAWGTAAFRRRVWIRAQGRRVRGMMARMGAWA